MDIRDAIIQGRSHTVGPEQGVNVIDKVARKAANHLNVVTGRTQARFAARVDQAHILCYHTIVPDEFADAGWAAPHAVTVSNFEKQMAMLAETAAVRSLGSVADRLASGNFTGGPLISITFDDGFADNALLALPILQRHGLTATFFLTTGTIDRGDLLPGDKIRILRDARDRGRLHISLNPLCERLLSQPGYHKAISFAEYRDALDELWSLASARVSRSAVEACRMLRWDEARVLRNAGMEIGAHTVNHVILSRESANVRRFEIVESIRRVRAEMRRESVPFAYPNGQPADFSAEDTGVLRELAVPCAVTTEAGPNTIESDRLTLKRHCIGLHHDVSSLWTALGSF